MVAPRAMAFFTCNADQKVGLTVSIHPGANWLKVGRVAFEAARNNGAVEIRVAIQVTRTIYPTKLFPVRDWKLKELIPFPIKKCLPLSAGTDYQAEPFRPRFGIWRYALHCCLEKS